MDIVNAVQQAGVSWYAIRTHSRHERVVRDQLTGRGIEPLLPTTVRTSLWKDRKKAIHLPLFPGYCFARFSLHERFPVLEVAGVVEIVGSNSPEPISERDIDAIKIMAAINLWPRYHPCVYMPRGTSVRIVQGALKGLCGVLVTHDNQYRVIISLFTIRQAGSVQIELTDVLPECQPAC